MLNFVHMGSPFDLKSEGWHGSSKPTKAASKRFPWPWISQAHGPQVRGGFSQPRSKPAWSSTNAWTSAESKLWRNPVTGGFLWDYPSIAHLNWGTVPPAKVPALNLSGLSFWLEGLKGAQLSRTTHIILSQNCGNYCWSGPGGQWLLRLHKPSSA